MAGDAGEEVLAEIGESVKGEAGERAESTERVVTVELERSTLR